MSPALAARRPLIAGIACALGAGMLWGLVFVVPLMLPEYPPAMLSFGRYLGFGVIALLLAWSDRARLLRLQRRDWRTAFELALVGNILYYLFLASAIQLADAPLPTMLIGTLPIVIAIVANFGSDALPWRRLLPSLAVMMTGIILVNQHEMASLGMQRNADDHYLGALLALAAVAAWTWYPVRNSRWLHQRPEIGPGTWALAQGLATLPLAAIGMAGAGVWLGGGFDYPLGPEPMRYLGLMLTLGLCASWLGTLLWNRASQLLPTALSGQLIVFETLAAFTYAFVWRGTLPGASALLGIALLVAGVVLGVRAFRAV
ncbi:MAG TPA: DMT family transporter [Candidatus Accumulibacter phosphatis]|nr:MAG: Inner membrane protein YtfF [Candidatus Accumulibacter sp. SK-11]HAY26436.1 EamA family transporter [Accumulibacter sp.]HCV14400.1 EamA family transporter [Accumulibacter sp.]HRL76606.1 DMT family transporter [Candidatus Accumulibacter phosphatis]HRQ94258.1 DMT family transporter [Candidatus Accumulibacter phosphatis]